MINVREVAWTSSLDIKVVIEDPPAAFIDLIQTCMIAHLDIDFIPNCPQFRPLYMDISREHDHYLDLTAYGDPKPTKHFLGTGRRIITISGTLTY